MKRKDWISNKEMQKVRIFAIVGLALAVPMSRFFIDGLNMWFSAG